MEIRAAACDLREDTDILATTHIQVLNVQCHWGARRISSFGPSLLLPGGKGHRVPSRWLPGRRQKGREVGRGGEGRLPLVLRCVDFHPDSLPTAGAQAGLAQLPALGGRVEQGLFPGWRLGRSTSHSSS